MIIEKNKQKKLFLFLFLLSILIYCSFNITNYHLVTSDNLIVMAEEVYEVPESKGSDSLTSGYFDVIDDIDGGNMLEKMLASVIASFVGAVMKAVTAITGFKDMNQLIFNTGGYVDGYTPLPISDWTSIKQWYVFMSGLASIFIFIAVLILFIKFIKASTNVQHREGAIASLKRLIFAPMIIGLAPIIIHLLLYINNNLVYAFYTAIGGGSLDGLDVASNVSLVKGFESPLAAAVVLTLFCFMVLKANIMFTIRNFNLIIYTIFTPLAAAIWIVDENINGTKVWLGELLSNIFMQMAYAFVFSIYITFAGDKGWVVQIIWLNLIFALGDVLRNMFQGKLTQLSGLNEGRLAGGILNSGLGVAAGLSGLAGTKNAFKSQMPNADSAPVEVSSNDNNISPNTSSSSSTNTSSSTPVSNLGGPNTSPKTDLKGSISGAMGSIAKGAILATGTALTVGSGNPQALSSVNKLANNTGNIVTSFSSGALNGASKLKEKLSKTTSTDAIPKHR